ncbi:unnamed protein product [Pleuronectes platessa]|uniref:Uncharacterized protein n=1 Tax=Pleuronectes platessa TaxID=8262 RepID=A0A9N7TKE0_PLEPL|nr:unnamed protein product [Pleuronectes platessa]
MNAHVFTFVFLLIALVLIISGLTVSIYKVKAWTLKTQQESEETQALNFQPNNEDPQLLREVEEVFSPVMVIESSSCSEVSSEDCGACFMEEGWLERGELEEPEDQEPEAVGNYDHGHVHLDVRVDLGDGDLADAYREG